jgi:nucleoside-diphosphate-sugar epimerase
MNPSSSLALVIGARGRFGRCAVEAFAAAGWRVIAQVRSPAAVSSDPRITVTSTPLADTNALAVQATGARVVVHAVNPALSDWQREAVAALRASAALARRLDATLMLPGNVYSFGASMPECLDEDTPEQPSTRKGAIRREMEALLHAQARDGLDSVVIRAGDFFGGSGTGTWFDQAIVKSIAHGKLVYPGPLDRVHAWAYLPDLARAFVAVASLPPAATPSARRLHFAGHALTGAELLDALRQAAHDIGIEPSRGWRHASLPWSVIRAGGLLVPAWRELAEMAYLWRVTHRLDGRALQTAVGELHATPLALALVQSLRALGWDRVTPVGAVSV